MIPFTLAPIMVEEPRDHTGFAPDQQLSALEIKSEDALEITCGAQFVDNRIVIFNKLLRFLIVRMFTIGPMLYTSRTHIETALYGEQMFQGNPVAYLAEKLEPLLFTRNVARQQIFAIGQVDVIVKALLE